MPVHIALLRGINVGGRHKLPMKELAAMFEDAGCRDVRTYIQSGNVVFAADAALARRIPELVGASIVGRFGFEAPLITRSAARLAAIVGSNPFAGAGADEKALHVAFLAATPAPDLVATLDPQRSPPDRFAVVGAEIYLHCPNGVARSQLTNAYFDARLCTTSTARNWRTTTKLLELASG